MPHVFFMVGPTGCGKTTFRKKHFPQFPCVSPDDFIIGKWTPTKARLAWEYARKITRELMSENVSFVLDAQFVNDKTRNQWRRWVEKKGYGATGVIFNTSWKQIQKNQRQRGDRCLYGKIPRNVQLNAYRTFRAALEKDPNLGFSVVITIPSRIK
jgi:predicted kinase